MQSNANFGTNRYDDGMAFDPRRLAVLRAVEEHRSFTSAAEALFTSQPAVSRQIARLEQEVAVQLVIRGPRQVALTPAGEALAAHARTLLPAIDAAEREMQSYASPEGGAVRLGAVPSVMASLVPEALAALRTVRPRVVVRLDESWSDDLLERIGRGELDLAIISAVASDVPTENTLLISEPFVAVLPSRHRLAGRRVLSLADLRGEPLIVAPSPAVRRELVRVCAWAGFVPEITATVGGSASERLVAAGIGIALIPASTAPTTHGLVVRPVPDVPRRNIVLAAAHRAHRTGAERDLEAALVTAARAQQLHFRRDGSPRQDASGKADLGRLESPLP
jgi:DNA-binding transcriptional LysR family regulator